MTCPRCHNEEIEPWETICPVCEHEMDEQMIRNLPLAGLTAERFEAVLLTEKVQ